MAAGARTFGVKPVPVGIELGLDKFLIDCDIKKWRQYCFGMMPGLVLKSQ